MLEQEVSMFGKWDFATPLPSLWTFIVIALIVIVTIPLLKFLLAAVYIPGLSQLVQAV